MEILKGFKQNGYFTADLVYNLLSQKKWTETFRPIKPSEYFKAMGLSTAERLQSLKDIEINNVIGCCQEKRGDPVLSLTPNIIIFQNFKQNDKIVAKFTVRNISTEPVFLNMTFKESSYFFIKFSGNRLLSRLAPGMSLPFTITFMPISEEDFAHRVTFTTEKNQYVLPIIAMGPRVVFDFPDEVTIPATPVKVESFIMRSIYNVGSIPGCFTLRTKSPFSVYPKAAFLQPGERVDIKIAFQTMHLGNAYGRIMALFETGESFAIDISSSAYMVPIELQRDIVRFPDTYTTMRRQQVFKITNKSPHLLKFMCMRNECIYSDFNEKRKVLKAFRGFKESEIKKDTKLIFYDVTSSEEHARVYTRIFFDEVQALVADETLHFQTTHFFIEPLEGVLWPNKDTELTITFSPKAIGDLEVIAFLDIDGIKERVPLKIVGTSLPPSLMLNIETLDMDRIYINKVYNYEIVVTNKGHINGAILYKEHPVLFGSKITCSPNLICLKPGEKDIFVLSFVNSNQGPFFEEIRFSISETDVVRKLYLKGEIIYPTLIFSTPCLDFGNVSVGVPNSLEIFVINECDAQVTASLKIAGDGPEISSIMLIDYAAADRPKPAVPEWPREFFIVPNKVVLNPVSRISLKITLIANLIRENQTFLEMELEKSDSPPIALPVTYQAMIPEITPAPNLRLPVLFLAYTYNYDIVFQTNDVAGYYVVEELEDPPPLKVNVKIKEALLEPNSTFTLPIEIRTDVVGTFEYTLRLLLFGGSEPVSICHITATGAVPIVTCTPQSLQWGQVQLLKKWPKNLSVCNDSPCTVHFNASVLNRDDKWQIEPIEGDLPPDSDTDFVVTLYMVDALPCSNKLVLNLNGERDLYVNLSATGSGTGIVIGDLGDRIDLGRHFIKVQIKCKVMLENYGTRMHMLEWTQQLRSSKLDKTSERPTAFFDVQPRTLKVAGCGGKAELTISAFTNKVVTMQESWYLIGAIEGVNKKEVLMECPITAEFVEPKLDLSPNLVTFRYDCGPYSEYYKLTDIITIKNVSKLPLDIEVSVKSPFAIVEKIEGYKVLSHEDNDCHCIKHIESEDNIEESLKHEPSDQPLIDYMTLEPVNPLRKGSLSFFEDINKIKENFDFIQSIEEWLEDQEVIKLQIVFDVTKHQSLKSKIYTDLVRIKFKTLKKKDTIKLTGELNFPNLVMNSQRIDFQCILNQSIQSKILQIQNVTPLKDCYRFVWKKCVITPIPTYISKGSSQLTLLEQVSSTSNIVSEETLLTDEISKINESKATIPEPSINDSVALESVVALESAVLMIPEEASTQKLTDLEPVELMETRVLKKVIPMIDNDYGTSIEWTNKFLKLMENTVISINEVFSLIPHRGILNPKEAQNIQVVFAPTRNIDAKAVLECQVLGGQSEWIVVTGQSSDLQFSIDTYDLNFKIRPFHSKATEKIILSNKALLVFEYKTYLNEPILENELEGIILSIDPSEKVVEANEVTELNVVVRPGVVGYFSRTFLIEVGHFPAVPINVFGWGGICQVYIANQNHDALALPEELSYLAISLLTTEYLEAVREIFSKNSSELSTFINKPVEDPQITEWEVINPADDLLPTSVDIELALERFLVTSHIRLHPEIMQMYASGKTGPIPSFSTMPCTVDFGVVMTGSSAHYTTDITNYGPINTKLEFSKTCSIPAWLEFKLYGKLCPGESGKMDVTFTPTADVFPEPEQNYEEKLYVEVQYGVTIPIVVQALCAVPYLVSSVSSINFGTVRCGDKAVASIPLRNIGKPTCIWYVTLKAKYTCTSPIELLESSGKYEPGKGGWFSVSFKPTTELHYEAQLVFRFHMNTKRMFIPVKGHGIIPRVHVIGPDVSFPPTLPWSASTDAYFGLTNLCPFPVELIFAHSDKQWDDEAEMYELLDTYYDKPPEMMVPKINGGDSWPQELVLFREEFDRRVTKETNAESTAGLKALASTRSTPKQTPKKGKSAKSESKQGKVIHKLRSKSEIIADVMQSLRYDGMDPLAESIHANSDEAPVEIVSNREGVLIIFHGSPCQEPYSKEMAYAVGKALHIPTINIDVAVVRALCECVCDAQNDILIHLNELYELAMKQLNKYPSNDNLAEEADEYIDEFDILWDKVYISSKCKASVNPRAKSAKNKSASTPVNSTIQGPIFQQELLQELLKVYFSGDKFHHGFILDGLTSIVFKSPPLVLTTVLKSKRSCSYAHLVLCQSDFSTWAQSYEDSLHEKELAERSLVEYTESEIGEIVEQVEEMSGDEYEEAPEEKRNVYITYGLQDRRLKHLAKKPKLQATITSSVRPKSSNVNNNVVSSVEDTIVDKKKSKKDDPKSSTRQTSEYILMNTKYNEYYKNTHDHLINIANNWILEDGELGQPLYSITGQLVGITQKKNKKSEVQVTEDHSNKDRGIPLTFITSPSIQYKDALIWMFVSNPNVKEAWETVPVYNILEDKEKLAVYSVLLPKTMPPILGDDALEWRFLDEPPIKKCECNELLNSMVFEALTQDEVINTLSKWHCICGKKMVSNQTSTTEFQSTPYTDKEEISNSTELEEMYPLPLNSVKSTSELESRIILEPGDLLRCKYSYKPKEEGTFNTRRYVEVSGWPGSRVTITATAIADIPRIDSRPKKMFANFIRQSVDDEQTIYKHVFLNDRNIFDFGPIFIGQHRVYEEEYLIDLRNSSLMKVEIEVEFQETNNVFQFDSQFITLEPGERSKVKVTAAPTEVGVHASVLLFCIKDNPEVVLVNIECRGVVPNIQIYPVDKCIEYGKLLLYRRQDDRFIIKNDSILPVMWKIRNKEEFEEDFIISSTTGIVPRLDNQVVPVTYIAYTVGTILRRSLIIDIYDEKGRGEPMITDALFLSAECYDVLVECAYEDPSENFLNYGNVKVNSTEVRSVFLVNHGKYIIYYSLKKVQHFPEPVLLKSFEASQDYGVLLPSHKSTEIKFICTPTTSMNLFNVPTYICSMLDGSKEQVVVAEFPINISIASFYNTFTLFPLGELNFGIIPIGVAVEREVIINNTSKCPFTFQIVLPPNYVLQPVHSTPSKGKDNKIKNPPLHCGNFTIISEDNLLAPGSSRYLQITFMGSESKKFEETVNFIISDTCPAEARGVPLKLIGIAAMPTLDFWNLEVTFREHTILKNLINYEITEPTPHCIFAEDSVTLHFNCVNVNSSYTATLDLFNNGLVPSILTMKLQYQYNSSADIFSLDKYETHIQPLSHKTLDIIFTPKALEEYRAVLNINLKLFENRTQLYSICLIGEGNIPRIQMIEPPARTSNITELCFPVTCLGTTTYRLIKFKNLSKVKSNILLEIEQNPRERNEFNISKILNIDNLSKNEEDLLDILLVTLTTNEDATVYVTFNPIQKGKTQCEVKITVEENPFEYYVIVCTADAFMEDIILLDLPLLPLELEYDSETNGATSVTSTDTKKRKLDKKKIRSMSNIKQSETNLTSSLKYLLDFGGCALCTMQRRSVIMSNNSEKVYRFQWSEANCIIIKPSVGYISPGEEKDFEVIFFSSQPVVFQRETVNCNLMSISDDTLALNLQESTWDNRQRVVMFDHNSELGINVRRESVLAMETQPSTESISCLNIAILYSATTEYVKFKCLLGEKMKLEDTFIYQKRSFEFTVSNIGSVLMKISWNFIVDKFFPARIDEDEFRKDICALGEGEEAKLPCADQNDIEENQENQTLFSGSMGRESADTWFEIDSPFSIEPAKACIQPQEKQIFKVTFAPVNAFKYKICLTSSIDNLDPYEQNICCTILAISLVPYFHLDIEESDYITAGKRKPGGITLPDNTTVLEFNVLGTGCHKKSFNLINPTPESYEFYINMELGDSPELVPMHCDMMKGLAEGGTSTEITFSFAPTAATVYESLWKLNIPVYDLVYDILVVGIVREAEVTFEPYILIIRHSLVDFTTTDTVLLRNPETEYLKFEIKGNSICDETGKSPVSVEPNEGLLKPCSDTSLKIIYTPLKDGPVSFKIFCSIQHMEKPISLCVKALSFSISPKVTYSLFGYEHLLKPDAITKIHLDQTASTYERTVPFVIENTGSATFCFHWNLTCASVKKYLTVEVIPNSGHVAPASQLTCILHFNLKQIPVQNFPVTLSITDGPEYIIKLYAEILKPRYYFTDTEYDFGKGIVNAPDSTYKRSIYLVNEDDNPIIVASTFENIPELYLHYHSGQVLKSGEKMNLLFYFRPKQVKEYEFKIQFWVNSMCEEILTIKGEGVPLLFDIYEGCQKSFNLGPVRVGDKIVKQIEVINHSKVPILGSFVFKDLYLALEEDVDDLNSEATSACLKPECAVSEPNPSVVGVSRVNMLQSYKKTKTREQLLKDKVNALSSVKVLPTKVEIKPHRKVPLKILFKPIGLISTLDVQLNMKVLNVERPLVRLSGSATDMYFYLSQNSLQFGCVRRKSCKVLKLMLINDGDFGSRFYWQPLISDEFTISPMKGNIAPHSKVTFTITYKPRIKNPFVKIWACCVIENYKPLEVSIFATCVESASVQNQTLCFSTPVRTTVTEYVTLTNPSDDMWLVLVQIEGDDFETLKEFHFEPNSKFCVPIHFRPRKMGVSDGQVLLAPLGEQALFLTLVGVSQPPNPNGIIDIEVTAKEWKSINLEVFHTTETPETYSVFSEVTKSVPEKLDTYYELKHPESVRVWGDAAAPCRWACVCFAECLLHINVMFVNVKTREYQFYTINVTVTPTSIVDTIELVSRARESVRKEIVISNPLSTDVEFLLTSHSLEIPDKLNVTKNSVQTLTMTYSPIVVGEKEEYLEVNNNLTGTYVYRIILKCLPAKTKKIDISTLFGTCIPLRLRVKNQTTERAEFVATVSHPCIILDDPKNYVISPSGKAKFLVWFEPTLLGQQNCIVSFNSQTAGEFVFDLTGKGTAPPPQGPFEVAVGGSTVIKFKNVFSTKQTFNISCNTSEFYVKSRSEQILPKKDIKITVFLEKSTERKMPTGTLTVECVSFPAEHNIRWTYFLQGVA